MDNYPLNSESKIIPNTTYHTEYLEIEHKQLWLVITLTTNSIQDTKKNIRHKHHVIFAT